MGAFSDYIPSLVAAVVGALALLLISRLSRWGGLQSRHRVKHQAVILGLSAVAFLVVILLLPFENEMRGQILSFTAILLSAAIALSSTTFLGNTLAGFMLRSVRSFRMGGFIRVGEHFGRVSDRGLFHHEIQTEDRNLVTLPNLFLVTNPVTTLQSTGTVISMTVSLGYDCPWRRVRELLIEAAERSELADPFVQVVELGDFSVTYRIAGLLGEVKHFVSARSRLREHALDALQDGGIEIVSPTFMNTRAFDPESRFMARSTATRGPEKESAPEAVVFDKAEEAASLESLRESLDEVQGQLKEHAQGEPKKGAPERAEWEEQHARLELRRTRLEKLIEARETREQ